MTREQLESYRSKKAEIAELHNMLLHLWDDGAVLTNDTILDYRKGYPVPQAVVGVDWDKVCRMENRYKNRIRELQEECQEIEDFIEDISDSLTRRIFRMHYIEGISQKNIAKAIHLEKSGVSKKISCFLQLSPKSTNSTL